MNKLGYEAAMAAYEKSFSAVISIYPPLPEDDASSYNERYIEVNHGDSPISHTQEYVAVLDNAGLMHHEGPRDLGLSTKPQLKVLGIMPGRILFEDMAYRSQ